MRRDQLGWPHFRQRTDGMSAVEFALLLPLMLLIVGGIMDFGNLYYQLNIVNEAAREAARIASTQKTNGNPANQTTVQTTIRSKFGNSLTLTLIPNPPTSGSSVQAKVTNSVTILTPIINQLITNNPITVIGICNMQVE
jgi:Flp pilus assembly protein TadG